MDHFAFRKKRKRDAFVSNIIKNGYTRNDR